MADAIQLTPALALMGIVLLVLGALAARRPVLFRIGARNFVRHKSTSALVVAGLLIGSAILSAAAVLGDSVAFTITRGTYDGLDLVDVEARDPEGRVFNQSMVDALVASPAVVESSDALAPTLRTFASVQDLDSGQSEPFMAVHAFDPVVDRGFGSFTRRSGGTAVWGDDLNATLVYLNARAAAALDAHDGDTLALLLLNPAAPLPAQARVQVAAVVADSGKGGYGSASTIFFRLDALQSTLTLTGKISSVRFSAPGDRETGATTSGPLADAATKVIVGLDPDSARVEVTEVKADTLDQAVQASEGIRIFLTIMGSFSIIAGVVLIINIFTMLAEERKVELGMGRAMGMRRSNLVQLFVFEGLTYSVAAAAAGTVVGVAIGAFLIGALNQVFGTPGSGLPIVVSIGSMLDAFALGVLLTLATISFAAYRLSRVNIITAVRDLPEPVTEQGSRRLAYAGGAVGALLFLFALATRTNSSISVLFLALGVVSLAMPVSRVVRPRIAFSTAALLAIAFVLVNLGAQTTGDGGIEQFAAGFIGGGVVIVFGGVLIVTSNSDVVSAGLAGLMSTSRSLRPAAKVAAAYPLYRRFRTGSTVAMFALVLFTIVVLSIFAGIFTSDIDEQLRDQTGGYEISGSSLLPLTITPGSSPVVDLRVETVRQFGSMRTTVLVDGKPIQAGGGGFGGGGEGGALVTVLGADPGFLRGGTPALSEFAPGYDQVSAWRAVEEGKGSVVSSSLTGGGFGSGPPGSGPGNRTVARIGHPITVNGTSAAVELVVVGITQSFVINGAIVSRSALTSAFRGDPRALNSTYFLFKPAAGEEIARLTLDLENEFRSAGMNTVNLRELLELSLAAFNNIFLLFQSFLALGLVVGVAGLAIITARNVVERKREIGVLRALGFRRSLVLKSQLIEVLLVVSLGVLIGLVVGIAFAAQLFASSAIEGVELTIPWERLGIIALVTYAAVLLASAVPVVRAARIRPSEALRMME